MELIGPAAHATYQAWGLIGLSALLFMVGTVTAGMWAVSLWSFRSAVKSFSERMDLVSRQGGTLMTQTQSIINAISDQQRMCMDHKERSQQLTLVFEKLTDRLHAMDVARAKELMEIILRLEDVIRGSHGQSATRSSEFPGASGGVHPHA